jgi:hypothetical protein
MKMSYEKSSAIKKYHKNRLSIPESGYLHGTVLKETPPILSLIRFVPMKAALNRLKHKFSVASRSG